MENETFDVLTKFQSFELFVGQGEASHKRTKANVTCSGPECLCLGMGGGGWVVQGRLLENSLILFDEKGLYGLFGVLVNLFEGVIILFTESGV